MLNKNLNIIILFLLICFTAFSEEEPKNTLVQDIKILEKALTTTIKNYVEEVDHTKIIRSAISGLLKELNDPYSYYMPPQAHQKMMENLNPEFGGVGIQISLENGVLTIIAPLDETPAKKAGLKAKDKILKIDGESTKDMTVEDASKKIRGAKGTEVTLTIERMEGNKKIIKDYTLTRDIIKIKMSRYRITEDKIGYLRLVSFTKNIALETEEALKRFEEEDIKALIFDLRHNPGGFLQSAVEVASYFTNEKKLVVYTKGRGDKIIEEYYSLDTKIKFTKPIILLIDNGSASASEIVAGALKDWNRAILIGEKTFGKGSVQQVFNMLDNSGLRLTVAKYFTPSGQCIHNIGLEPHIIVSLPSNEEISKILKEKKEKEEKQQKKEEEEQNNDNEKGEIIDEIKLNDDNNDTEKIDSDSKTEELVNQEKKSIEKLVVEEYDTQLKFALNYLRVMLKLIN
ncbi:MAG TPA: S41 family peptidase [bacterium]|nr:S41 family peptidase [bacterium]HOL47670.1 S41 family peptidase [bacterium]HPQ18427.1 S41 family peptidase [bacterium]